MTREWYFLPHSSCRVLSVPLLVRVGTQEDGIEFVYNENTAKQSDNIMDKWIQSFTQSLIQFFKAEMDGELTDADTLMTV